MLLLWYHHLNGWGFLLGWKGKCLLFKYYTSWSNKSYRYTDSSRDLKTHETWRQILLFYESLRRSPATKSHCCCWVSILFGRAQKSFMLWKAKVHQRNHHEGLSFLVEVTFLSSFLTHGQTKCTLSHGSNSHTGHVGWLNRPLSAMELWLWRGEWPQGWGPNLNCHTGLACLLLFPSLNKNSFVVNQDMSCLQSRQF